MKSETESSAKSATFCGLKLLDGTTKKNTFGMFVNTFAVTAFLNFKSIAITYLLVKDYAVPQAQAG